MITQTFHSSKEQSGGSAERTRTVSLAEGRQLAYTEYGPSSGTPVMFLHGTPGSRRLGKLFKTTAQEHRIRLLAPDRPGYGKSSPWPDRSIRDAKQFVGMVLDDADVDTVSLIAFSGGAPYAFAAAETHAHRIEQIDIVAGAPPPEFTGEKPALQRLLHSLATTMPILLRGAFRTHAWLAQRRDPSFVLAQYTAEGGNESISKQAAEIVREDFVEALSSHRSGVVTEFQHAASNWDVNLEAIHADVRLWHGENDTNVPIAAVQRFESDFPAAELRVIDNADHLQTLLQCVPEILEGYNSVSD